MFILSYILNIYNDSTRKGGTSRKDRACKATFDRIRDSIRNSKARSSFMQYCRGFGKGYVSIRSKSEQCTLDTKARRIRVYLSLIPLFIFYNPNILIAFIYIDIMFSDELIYINILQLNSIYENIQRFNNIGVV